MNWNKKHLDQLVKNGNIKGYKSATQQNRRNIPQKKKNNIPKFPEKRSAALIWLDLNLQYWCNERQLTLKCSANGEELKFDEVRKWRFDYAIEALKIAVEYEGGVFMKVSGHNTAKHYTKDTDKYNRAQALGWRIIRLTAINYKTVLQTLNSYVA